MFQTIKVGEIQFPHINVQSSLLHKVRGYFSTKFKDYDLIHNHNNPSQKFYYRYPAFQFKTHQHLAIFAFKEEAIEVMKALFLQSHDICIEGESIPVTHKQIEIREVTVGEDDQYYLYRFLSPWLPLNQENFRQYVAMSTYKEKQDKLNSILINNIFSFCKFAQYTVTQQLKVKSQFKEIKANLKGYEHFAFTGEFMINIKLPDFIGLGKSSSRGYGTIINKL